MNITARIARETALERHRAEVDKLNLRLHRRNIAMIAVAFFSVVAGSTIHMEDWQTDPPPPLHKVEVVSYGFQDRERVWRSYDTGEVIEVKKWK